MSALDTIPLAATVGAACGAIGTAVGAWAKGRAQTKTAAVTAHARETVAVEETARAQLALVPALIARITALEAQVARHTVEIAEGVARESTLAQRVTEFEARAVLAEREATLQSARADLAEMAATDAQRELAKWRDQSNAAD